MDLISLLVGSDRLVEGNLPCRFLFAPKIHQQLIINTAGGVCGQPVSFFRIICHHRLDEADRSNGNQIVEIIGQALILFHNVRDQAQIPLDQNVSGFCIAPLIRIQTAFFFLCRQWF